MKLTDFAQEAKEKYSEPPYGSFPKQKLARLAGIEPHQATEFIKQGIKDGKVECVGSYPYKHMKEKYYMMVE